MQGQDAALFEDGVGNSRKARPAARLTLTLVSSADLRWSHAKFGIFEFFSARASGNEDRRGTALSDLVRNRILKRNFAPNGKMGRGVHWNRNG